MRKLATVIGILALSIGFALSCASSLGADKTTKQSQIPAFVDMDGDGFDDRATPEELNSTADKTESIAGDNATDTTNASNGFFDLNSTQTPKSQLFLNNSSAFASAKRMVICGLQNRGGFGSGSDFGSGGDISSGAVIAGVCVGGVCH